MSEQCEDCPLRTGQIPRTVDGMKAMSRRLGVIEKRCEDRPPLCTEAINSKVGHKVFWPIVTLFVVITGSIVGFSLSSQKEYYQAQQRVNSEIIDSMNNIETDVAVIKSKIENGGGL